MPSNDRPVQEWRKQAFDLSAESTKQLITVATGVVTVTILFSKDLDKISRYLAYAAWVALVVSVMFGIAVLLNLSGNLQHAADGRHQYPSVTAKGIPFLSIGQILTFGAGIILLFVFGLFAVNGHIPPDTKPITVNCILPPPPQPPPQPAGGEGSSHPPSPTKHRRRCCCCTRKPQIKQSEVPPMTNP
ncbi:hypothetical protein [Tunturiibacter lichenicola]|jgi:hypothetical protein|uniref:hypothetical protein n=1 Tax=Tunturiibacter lichenicola TaxID=2051959 RepID=UPI003D9B6AC7